MVPDNDQERTICVGVDIGGGTVKIGVLEGERLVHREAFPTDPSGCPERLLKLVRVALTGARVDIRSVRALGIGMPGLVDDGKLVLSANLPGWIGVPVGEAISENMIEPARVFTDICAMAYAEHVVGALKSSTRGMVFTLGTGFGSGAVLDGAIYGGGAGMTLAPTGISHGNDAELVPMESLIAGPAIARHAGEIARDAERLAEAARDGDLHAKAIWDKVGRYFGLTAYNVACLFWLETVVLTGGISGAGDLILEPAREFFREHGQPLVSEQCKLQCSAFPENAGIIGAALAARDGRSQRQNVL